MTQSQQANVCLIKSYDARGTEIRSIQFLAETEVTVKFAEQLAERLAYVEALHAGTRTQWLRVKSLDGKELAVRNVDHLKVAMGFRQS